MHVEGAITDAIEVKEEVTPVETGTAAAATTIDGTQVRELALNTRNYEALVALMPGVAIKAFSAVEIFFFHRLYGMSVEETLRRLPSTSTSV